MAVSIGRKLQALRDLCFSDLTFEVLPVALSVEQVRELGLPSTPLKESERRADRWRAAFGVEQTEIDALATLRPAVLERIVIEAIEPYHDRTLETRVAVARNEWRFAAERWLAEQTDEEALAYIRAEAETKLAEMREQIDALNEQLRVATEGRFELPEIEIPEPKIDPTLQNRPLISSLWPWIEQTRALRARKAYGAEAEE